MYLVFVPTCYLRTVQVATSEVEQRQAHYPETDIPHLREPQSQTKRQLSATYHDQDTAQARPPFIPGKRDQVDDGQFIPRYPYSSFYTTSPSVNTNNISLIIVRRYMLSSCVCRVSVCSSVCLSVRHTPVFYENG